MLLKSIKLVNFRQYKGTQEVIFSSKEDSRNVTVLLGKNTGGKTTFVQAFRWVLYGDDDFTGKKSKTPILNLDVARTLRKGEEESAEVELTLFHNNMEYIISRVQKYVSRETATATADGSSILKVLCKYPDGETRRVEEKDTVKINEMLPQELSEYFFFDGEKIKNVTNKRNIEQAVNAIMGLTPLNNMISHLETVHRRYQSQLVGDGTTDVSALTRKKERYVEEQQTLNENKDMYELQLDDAEKKKSSCDVAATMVKQYTVDAKRRTELENNILRYKKRKYENSEELIKSFSDGMYSVYSYPLTRKIVDSLNDLHLEDKGIPEMSSTALKYILDNGVCICGKELKNDPESIEHIKKLMDYLPPASIGTQIKHLIDDSNGLIQRAPRAVEALENAYSNFIDSGISIEEADSELQEVSDRLKNAPDLEKIEEDRERANCSYAAAKNSLITCEGKIRELSRSIESIDHDIREATASNKENERVNRIISRIVDMHTTALRIKGQKSENNLNSLRTTIKEVFDSMYHGQRDISIDDHYNVTLSISKFGRKDMPDASTGLDTVKNFAFVASLLKMAKDSISSNEDEISSEPYPMVMDAAFSNTDEIHIQKISEQLPNLAQQAVIALMDRDWKYAKNTLEPHIHRIYRLNKISETETVIELEAQYE